MKLASVNGYLIEYVINRNRKNKFREILFVLIHLPVYSSLPTMKPVCCYLSLNVGKIVHFITFNKSCKHWFKERTYAHMQQAKEENETEGKEAKAHGKFKWK